MTDEDILAELEKGLGGFIDSLVVDPDPVRNDINGDGINDLEMLQFVELGVAMGERPPGGSGGR